MGCLAAMPSLLYIYRIHTRNMSRLLRILGVPFNFRTPPLPKRGFAVTLFVRKTKVQISQTYQNEPIQG